MYSHPKLPNLVAELVCRYGYEMSDKEYKYLSRRVCSRYMDERINLFDDEL